ATQFLLVPSAHEPNPTSQTSSTLSHLHNSAEYAVQDTLRHGFRSVKGDVMREGFKHPVEGRVGESWAATKTNLKYNMYRTMYGVHAPIRLQMERALVSQPRRLPVLPTSNFALDILEGRDETLEFEDFLGGE
ncbi:hypothetical protein M427DRAFT_59448, partial [Gonapodya prolifera JEL478]